MFQTLFIMYISNGHTVHEYSNNTRPVTKELVVSNLSISACASSSLY
jgi:hypothetical protein